MSYCTWGESKVRASTIWGTDWDYYSAANHIVITLCPTPCYILEVLIITTRELSCCSNHSPEWHLWYAYFSKAHRRLSSSGDYKRTQQGALVTLLLYLYKLCVVCATTISTYPNVHTSSSYSITHLS